jgi:hypothetical protein
VWFDKEVIWCDLTRWKDDVDLLLFWWCCVAVSSVDNLRFRQHQRIRICTWMLDPYDVDGYA